jgi:hypothetical protein
MTTSAEKISALEWGIYALELKIKEAGYNQNNPLVMLVIVETKGKINVLTEMKAELGAKE